jgi:hypothetical protein
MQGTIHIPDSLSAVAGQVHSFLMGSKKVNITESGRQIERGVQAFESLILCTKCGGGEKEMDLMCFIFKDLTFPGLSRLSSSF